MFLDQNRSLLQERLKMSFPQVGEISYMTKQKLIMFISFIQPVAFGSWLLRIPDVQAKLRRGPAELAFALLGMPTGTLLTLPVAGRLVARIGR
ncbi:MULTISPECIES: hypothetical protein [unclassified Rhizobium]|uniref:hypothetical protein n=1 Tax=unclassified Rhizobium TaxID=2613769 RepID=UPI00380C0D3D